jgi:hypothetical protein
MMMDCKSVAKKRGYFKGLLKYAVIFQKIFIDFKIQARKENERTRNSTFEVFHPEVL